MESHIVKILEIGKVTHDVLSIKTEKPAGYAFVPGQATEIAINDPEWENAKRPFTFTNLPEDDHLEFTIKTYPEKKGVTNHLRGLQPGDELIVHDVWGAIHYKGKGLFIAGGAGITPFIAIFRYLEHTNKIKGNRLLFANKTKEDIILEPWFRQLLKENFINVLSDEQVTGIRKGYITAEVLKEVGISPDDHLYICGPPPMVDSVQESLKKLGVAEQSVVVEI